MTNLNGQYIAAMPFDAFLKDALEEANKLPWGGAKLDQKLFSEVAKFMQSRVKRFVDIAQWEYFFVDEPSYDEEVCEKLLKDENHRKALASLPDKLAALADFTAASVEKIVEETASQFEIPHGKLNQPLRAAVTGTNIGAGIFETIELIGKDRTIARLRKKVQA